jgi:IclR family acetate operon transcriptional repressor
MTRIWRIYADIFLNPRRSVLICVHPCAVFGTIVHNMKQAKPYAGTQAVLRAISLLKVFSDERPSWSLAELVKHLALNKTTVFRLLSALQSEGLIAHNAGEDTYSLGSELVALGGRALRSNDLRTLSRQELKTLAQNTGESATMEILVQRDVLIIDEVQGEHLLSAGQWIGTRWPAHATSTGKSMLAHLSGDQLDQLLQEPLPRFTSKTITSIDSLKRELAKTRQRGYAIANEELQAGFVAIGAPVRNHTGDVIAATSVGGPSIRLSAPRVPQIGKMVIQAAERLSAQLGYRPKSKPPR